MPMLKEKPTQEKLLKDIEYPLVHVLSRVEQNGAKIDKKKLANHSKELGQKIDDLSAQAFKIAGEEFNLDSPKQLLEILYEKQGLPVLKKTPKGQPSTNEDTLKRLSEEYELPRIILQYRTLAKLKSTYTDSLINIENPKTERIHTSYQQAVTSTGRLSSTEPNLQNIPIKTAEGRRIREAFVPDKGNILIYNGEIFNYYDLCNRYKNFKPKTQCDTELLAWGLDEFGIDFLEEIDSMHAFALWDIKKKQLILKTHTILPT